jgi:hypothetical protein
MIFGTQDDQNKPSIHGIIISINDFVQILGDDLGHPVQLLEVEAPTVGHEGGQGDGRQVASSCNFWRSPTKKKKKRWNNQ